MSSSDRGRVGLVPAAAFAILLAGLAACTVQPVYMSASNGGSGGSSGVAQADLSAIDIPPGGDRVGQQVRNNLVFLFRGGRPATEARYTLSLATTTSEFRLGFEKDETAPAYQVTVAVRYELKEIAGDRVIERSVANGVATYDRSNQNFANARARVDAENRAAEAVAEQINLRLSIALAKEKARAPVISPPPVPAAASSPAAPSNAS